MAKSSQNHNAYYAHLIFSGHLFTAWSLLSVYLKIIITLHYTKQYKTVKLI
jgi:hypothetical protein